MPTIRALNLMNGHVSISTSAYSIYNAANRNDADNSSWFRVIRRCIYRSSITGGMFALRINNDSITFLCGALEKISVKVEDIRAFPELFIASICSRTELIIEHLKNRSLYHGTRSSERPTRELK